MECKRLYIMGNHTSGANRSWQIYLFMNESDGVINVHVVYMSRRASTRRF